LGDKPVAAFVLSLLGGLCVLAGGLFQAFIGDLISTLGMANSATNATGIGSTIGILGIVGIVFGIVMILGGVMMFARPQTHKMWGAIVLILSIVSFATSSFGGFFIGFLLGLIGAILGLTFKPSMAPSMMPGQSMGPMPMGSMSMGTMGNVGSSNPIGQGAIGMTCRSCGSSIPAGANHCPNCGANL
jgi:hypothetical protein